MSEQISATEVIDAGQQAVFLNNVLDFFGDDEAGIYQAILYLGVSKAVLEKAMGIEPVEVIHG